MAASADPWPTSTAIDTSFSIRDSVASALSVLGEERADTLWSEQVRPPVSSQPHAFDSFV